MIQDLGKMQASSVSRRGQWWPADPGTKHRVLFRWVNRQEGPGSYNVTLALIQHGNVRLAELHEHVGLAQVLKPDARLAPMPGLYVIREMALRDAISSWDGGHPVLFSSQW